VLLFALSYTSLMLLSKCLESGRRMRNHVKASSNEVHYGGSPKKTKPEAVTPQVLLRILTELWYPGKNNQTYNATNSVTWAYLGQHAFYLDVDCSQS